MKKLYFILLCTMLGVYTAFGQEVAVQEISDNAADTESPAGAAVSDDAAEPAVPAGEEIPNETLSTETPTELSDEQAAPGTVSGIPANGEDTESESGGTASDAERTTIITEISEPAQRSKQRTLSMHTGLILGGTVANNAVSITDLFKRELVIDFDQLLKKTMKSGLHAGILFNLDWFFQFTVKETHTVRFSTTVNADGWGNMPKSFLELMAKGNAANADGKSINGTFNAKLNAFADTGVMYQFKQPSYGISGRLAYFVPIAYMENPRATYSISPIINNGVTEGLVATAQGTVDIYGHVPASSAGKKLSVAELFKNGGLDLSLAGFYRPTDWVTVNGAVDYLPLMVVKMNTGMRQHFKLESRLENLLDGGNGQVKTTTDQGVFTTLPEKNVMRPCKIHLGADFRPLRNDYLILSPFLAFPVINAKPYYADGGLKIESRFAKVLGVYLDTGCIERIWRHELCFFVDSRWCTFTLAASLASQDFRRTFTSISGLGFKLGLGFGF